MFDLVCADPELLGPILDATHEIWHDGLSRAAYEKYWLAQRRTPWGRDHLRFFALVEDGLPVASAKLYMFRAVLDGVPVVAAAIGAVFTRTLYRRRGHARALVEQLLELAAGE